MNTFKNLLTFLSCACTMAVVNAQETPAYNAVTAFVSHPVYCIQLVNGDEERLSDGVDSEFSTSLAAAIESTGKGTSKEALGQINTLCASKIASRANGSVLSRPQSSATTYQGAV
ncbi:hypothetical protein LP417_33995 (plasmid) [Polaromonas sp. P1-6]|nr:hypothetical protein LP417_33995 [Polaromonas sp. P1-6]